MYLLYVDESGDVANQGETYFVLAGISVFERTAYWVSETLDRIQERYFPGQFVEFHARTIHNHNEPPWSGLPSEVRKQILGELYRAIGTNADISLFGIALEKNARGGPEPIARVFEEICNRFDLFLKRLHHQGDTQRGLMVFDESKYESRLQTLLKYYRGTGTRFGRIRSLADVPFFADSKATRLLQVADLVAYAIFRRYERGDTQYLDQIVGRFDSENEILHGLVHLTANNSCVCPACATRRRAGAQI